MRSPDCTAKAFQAFLGAPVGEEARRAFSALVKIQGAEEKMDAQDRRQPSLPGLVEPFRLSAPSTRKRRGRRP